MLAAAPTLTDFEEDKLVIDGEIEPEKKKKTKVLLRSEKKTLVDMALSFL